MLGREFGSMIDCDSATEMGERFLSGYDLDWFACLEDGHVAHFATGGQRRNGDGFIFYSTEK